MKDPINTLQELERNSKTPADGCAPNPMHTAEWLAARQTRRHDAPAEVQVEDERVKQLRALGYVQ